MKGKLIKRSNSRFDFYTIEDINQVNTIASSFNNPKGKLSVKNCEAIELGYNLDELEDVYIKNQLKGLDEEGCEKYLDFIKEDAKCFIKGAKTILEILKDKKFSEKDVREAYSRGQTNSPIQSLQQTEWDVEVVMEKIYHTKFLKDKELKSFREAPLLDSDGCLILKRI